jgi:predicted dehydrogenase
LEECLDKVRVGIVGLGYLGRFHLEKYLMSDDVNVTAVSDISEESLKRVKNNEIIKTKNYIDILQHIDAVSIVTPTETHFEIAKFFLENGKDVLLEKPITTTVSEADKLIEISEKNGNIFQIGHLERFNPAVVACQKYLGRPMFIECIRISPYIGRSIDTDVIRDLMIHDIDIILSIVKSRLKNVHAVGVPILTDKIDIANARLVFESGCVVNITASRVSFKRERKIRIFQENRYISLDYEKRKATVYTLDKKDKKVIKPLDFLSCFKMNKIKFPKKIDQLEHEIKSFINCVKKRVNPPVSGKEGRNALDVALKILNDLEEKLNGSIC